MENRLNKRVEQYITKFKQDIGAKISELDIPKQVAADLMEFVYEYERLVFNKPDLEKRKRVKNAIPTNNRCSAIKACGEQCTRRRKEGSECCGTHSEYAPNGVVTSESVATKRVEVFAEEISGIVYYLDKMCNVYKHEDVLDGKENPEVIGKYRKDGAMTILL
jgi:hypothetical protein